MLSPNAGPGAFPLHSGMTLIGFHVNEMEVQAIPASQELSRNRDGKALSLLRAIDRGTPQDWDREAVWIAVEAR